MKAVMNSIISEEQFAFVENRHISECIVALQGMIEDAKEKKKESFVYKIDFSKAYDFVEWSFLEDMMRAFRFDETWIRWILACVTTSHASVLVNGRPSGDFSLGRDLRQGDPLSHFLFILVVVRVGIIMSKGIEQKRYEPSEIGEGRLRLCHIQFADGTVFVGKASIKNAVFLKRSLWLLEWVSGLKINVNKCSLIGLGKDEGLVMDIVEILGCKVGKLLMKYLGLSVGSAHKRISDWKYVVDKIRNKIKKWENLKISIGGRLTLVNSVLNSIPIYALSVFWAPFGVLKSIVVLC